MQSVLTPRSNTMTGTPLAHAASTAGVRVAVVDGETMMASQSPASTKACDVGDLLVVVVGGVGDAEFADHALSVQHLDLLPAW